jgi:dimethylaniline monooxygenase (N-oxide forming)
MASGNGQSPTVGVIGGGVSGLQVIRALQAKGFKVKAFERDSNIGGVWKENYHNFGVQVPKQLYEFLDFPFNLPWGQYPTGPETQKYIEDYADHFKLRDSLVLGSKVQSVKRSGDKWIFSITRQGRTTQEQFDYCVVSTGLYSKHNKNLPLAPDSGKFKGKIMHSSDFTNSQFAAGKKVVVIGGGKSAIDCALEASKVPGAKVTLLSRQPHWPTPRKIADLIPFQYVFLSRLGQALVTGHRGALPGHAGAHCSGWHKIGWPCMAGAFKAVEVLFAAQFRNMRGSKSPLFKADVVDDFYGYAQVLDYDFRDAVRAGKIEHRIGAASGFVADGLMWTMRFCPQI